MISNGDDSHNNQVRVALDGKVYLSQDITGLTDIDGLKFRLETFIAGNGYVGPEATQNAELIGSLHRKLKANWPKPKYGGFVDIGER